uniref:Sucrase-isomaltase, intestinal n=1 Tax=Anisakis pegreffii TaxID=303229 RepID=A0A3G6JE30_9BILA|nr:sucrase-isomaltase, intestinal [Anisakis pegreffii]
MRLVLRFIFVGYVLWTGFIEANGYVDLNDMDRLSVLDDHRMVKQRSFDESIMLPRKEAIVQPIERVNCMPEIDNYSINRTACQESGCIYDRDVDRDQYPPCYLPRRSGYVQKGAAAAGSSITLESLPDVQCRYGDNLSPIEFSAEEMSGSTQNIRISKPGRFEPKLHIPRGVYATGEQFSVTKSNSTGVFSFKVIRNSTNAVVWDTSIGGMMFADQFIQIAAYVGAKFLYGIGENSQQTLKLKLSQYQTWPMFGRNHPVDSTPVDYIFSNRKNAYGVYPFYVGIEADSKAHGVLILNSNAQEIELAPGPHVIYRTIGGILDLYFFPGPTAEDVIKQYLALVGYPELPPYWSLGFQLSRSGYNDLEEMKTAVANVRNASIPIDVAHADVDYMDMYQDFTIGSNWQKLPEYVQEMHADGMRVTLALDPTIAANSVTFETALNAGAGFIEWERMDQVPKTTQSLYQLANNTKIMLGIGRPSVHVAFPDFSTARTTSWWALEIENFWKKVTFDGLVLSMNEPANFRTNGKKWRDEFPYHGDLEPLMCPLTGNDSNYDAPPYQTYAVYLYDHKDPLSSKTLCMLGRTSHGPLYDTKSIYSLHETQATSYALSRLQRKRPHILTRSSFPSTSRHAGHWLGDNFAHWHSLRASIVAIQDLSIFGVPYVGADICGTIGDASEELCLRWQQLGAFYTFMRNNNDRSSAPQEPSQWPSVAAATRQANRFRYNYLPYLYTLLYKVAVVGGTAIRPVFFEFQNDDAALHCSNQFMWGPAMLIVPVIEQGAERVYAYLPRNATWYSLRNSDYGTRMSTGFQYVAAPLTQLIPVYVRGGYIVPRQAPGLTTAQSRNNPFEILIAFDDDGSRPASGTLFWDDGESLLKDKKYCEWSFSANITPQLTSVTIKRNGPKVPTDIPTLDRIEIFGCRHTPQFESAKLNGRSISITNCSTHDSSKGVISISCEQLLKLNSSDSEMVLTWSHTLTPPTTTATRPPAVSPSTSTVIASTPSTSTVGVTLTPSGNTVSASSTPSTSTKDPSTSTEIAPTSSIPSISTDDPAPATASAVTSHNYFCAQHFLIIILALNSFVRFLH